MGVSNAHETLTPRLSFPTQTSPRPAVANSSRNRDTADIAATSHRIIVDGPKLHAGKAYVLTGPRLMNMPELAIILSNKIGHKVRYLHLPGPIFKRLLKLGGMDDFMANGLVAQFVEIIRPGLEGVEVSADIEKIIGRKATSFEEWVTRNKQHFEGFDAGPYIAAGVIGSLAILNFVAMRLGN